MMDDIVHKTYSEAEEEPSEFFPIRTVSALTGVNSVTLRAWERRYNLITPIRTPSGHRLYSQEDIDKINKAIGLLEKGMSISQAGQIINNQLKIPEGIQDSTEIWKSYRERIMEAVMVFDEVLLDEIYQQALSFHPVQTVTRMLIIPSLRELGTRWKYAEGGVAEEHFFSVFLRNKLGARFHHRSRNNTGPKLLGACLPHETHETGLLLFALAADEQNYRQVLLGASMPLQELPVAAKRANADAIVLSGKTEPPLRVLETELPYLTKQIEIPVFVGGDVSSQFNDIVVQANAIPLGTNIDKSLQKLDHHLKNRHSEDN